MRTVCLVLWTRSRLSLPSVSPDHCVRGDWLLTHLSCNQGPYPWPWDPERHPSKRRLRSEVPTFNAIFSRKCNHSVFLQKLLPFTHAIFIAVSKKIARKVQTKNQLQYYAFAFWKFLCTISMIQSAFRECYAASKAGPLETHIALTPNSCTHCHRGTYYCLW